MRRAASPRPVAAAADLPHPLVELTFIVLARSALGPAPTGMLTEAEVREEIAAATMTGDVNIFLHEPDEDGAAADLECEVMIAGASAALWSNPRQPTLTADIARVPARRAQPAPQGPCARGAVSAVSPCARPHPHVGPSLE